jgi:poly(hydroxyalkanoate) granule-associated protein
LVPMKPAPPVTRIMGAVLAKRTGNYHRLHHAGGGLTVADHSVRGAPMPKKPNPFNPFGDDEATAQFAASVRASAQNIWLAGLGAFAKAQAEGSKIFDNLVKEGAGMQGQSPSAAQQHLKETAARVDDMASAFGARAAGQWDKLEGLFEDRMAKGLRKLGVPRLEDLEQLAARVDALERAAQAPARRPRAARKSPNTARHAADAATPQPALAKRSARQRSTPRQP